MMRSEGRVVSRGVEHSENEMRVRPTVGIDPAPLGYRRAGPLRWLRACALLGAIGCGFVAKISGAVEFDVPPTVGDRKVSLTWQADPDDPYFTGNTVLAIDRVFETIHRPGQRVGSIALTSLSENRGYSHADGDDFVREWSITNGAVLRDLPLEVDEPVTNLSLHGSSQLLFIGHPSGQAELHDLVAGTVRVLDVSSSRLNQIKFFSTVLDPTDLRFVTASDGDSVGVWLSTIAPELQLRVNDGPSYAIEIDRTNRYIAVGGAGGFVRVWDLTNPRSPQKTSVQHRGAVREIRINRDGTRMATSDDTGEIRLWNLVSSGAELDLIDVVDSGLPGTPRIDFSFPDGTVLIVALPDGRGQLYDGRNLDFYRELELSASTITTTFRSTDGRRVAVGDDNGVVTTLQAGQCVPSIETPTCFGGYKIWRATRPDSTDIRMIRVYGFGDSTWSFVDQARAFVDPDSILIRVQPPDTNDPDAPLQEITIAGPHNGVPYFYSITRFDRVFNNGSVFDVYRNTIADGFYRDFGSIDPTPIVATAPGRAILPLLEHVYVVPDPYERGRVPWDAVAGEHVEFRNLPVEGTVRIYTVAGDLVRVLTHGLGQHGETRSALTWDLRNTQGRTVASGVYVFRVETPSGEVVNGYFTVVM